MECLETGWLNPTEGRICTPLQWRKSLPQSHFKISSCWRGEQNHESQNIFTNSQPHDFWSSSNPKHLRTSLSTNGIMNWLAPFDRAVLIGGGEVCCLKWWKCINMWWILDFWRPSQKISRGLVSSSLLIVGIMNYDAETTSTFLLFYRVRIAIFLL